MSPHPIFDTQPTCFVPFLWSRRTFDCLRWRNYCGFVWLLVGPSNIVAVSINLSIASRIRIGFSIRPVCLCLYCFIRSGLQSWKSFKDTDYSNVFTMFDTLSTIACLHLSLCDTGCALSRQLIRPAPPVQLSQRLSMYSLKCIFSWTQVTHITLNQLVVRSPLISLPFFIQCSTSHYAPLPNLLGFHLNASLFLARSNHHLLTYQTKINLPLNSSSFFLKLSSFELVFSLSVSGHCCLNTNHSSWFTLHFIY